MAAKNGKKAAGASQVTSTDTRSGMVMMRFTSKAEEKVTSQIGCLGEVYKRRPDGCFLVRGQDVAALRRAGLVPA